VAAVAALQEDAPPVIRADKGVPAKPAAQRLADPGLRVNQKMRRVEAGMGYISVLGACYVCGGVFVFSPKYVPSVNGEPICEGCITRVNAERQRRGLPLWPVHPDAYIGTDEADM
jgi:hypothetical protein